MKNGILVIGVFIVCMLIIINSPALVILWFLGGDKPFKHALNMANNICWSEKIK